MYCFSPLDARQPSSWKGVPTSGDRTVFQTQSWVAFISDTQAADPVLLALRRDDRTVGYFIGLMKSRYGVRILGSPFPGWSTDYMGFVLEEGECRKSALEGLLKYAFDELGCAHVEMMDRQATMRDILSLNVQSRLYQTFLIDLQQDEESLFENLTSACRRCIRKAEKNGVVIEVADADGFAEDYFGQLQDVFAKQSLVPTYGLDRVKRLIGHLHPTGQLLLLRARDRHGKSIATALLPHFNGTLHFWGGASWSQHQCHRPNEALHWYAMMYAKNHGLKTYDMGGAGEYKKKYGGQEITIPWIRKSSNACLASARNLAHSVYTVSQKLTGRFNRLAKLYTAASTGKA